MSTRVRRSFPFVLLSLVVGVGLALAVSGLAGAEAGAAQPASSQAATEAVALQQPSGAATGLIFYVAKDGAGTFGLSWTTAFTDLQTALAVAISGDEIWVASGVYTPGTSPSDSFDLVPGVAVYGGFAGTEVDRAARDWVAHPTVLSGDIAGDDVTDANGVVTTTAGIVGTNSEHVVRADGVTGGPITGTTRLDGFTITGGQTYLSLGGGLYCSGASGGVCSPTLANLIFSGNAATYGGALYDDGYLGTSSPALSNVIFTGNLAYQSGGAMYNHGPGGVSSPSLVNVIFAGNAAMASGGAMVNNALTGVSDASVVNATFWNNTAGAAGGAIYNDYAAPNLTNVILWANSALTGTAIANVNSTVAITRSLIAGGLAEARGSTTTRGAA